MIRAVTGPDARLDAALAKICDDLNVETTSPGARVWLTRFGSETHVLAGTTPLRKLAIPHGEYLLAIEKDGFAPLRRRSRRLRCSSTASTRGRPRGCASR